MKFHCSLLLTLLALYSLTAHANTSVVVSPAEITANCVWLYRIMPGIEHDKSEGVSLSAVISATQQSISQAASSANRPDQVTRTLISAKELISLIYAPHEPDPQGGVKALTAACQSYAPDQYTEKNIADLMTCNFGIPPLKEMLAMKHSGMDRNQMFAIAEKSLESHISSNESKAFLYENTSRALNFVYSQPEMTIEEIATKMLGICFEESKIPPGVPQLPGFGVK